MPHNTAGEFVLEKGLKDLKKPLIKLTFALLILSILASTTAFMPVANAQDQALIISPTQGPAGASVTAIAMGFSSNSRVSINFDTKEVAYGLSGSMFGRMSTGFIVPSLSLGTYTVTAADEAGHSASATFTITAKTSTTAPGITPKPSTPTGTGATGTTTAAPTPTPWYYTYKPTASPAVVAAAGFWSLPLIGAIVAAFAIAFIGTFILVRRRGGKPEIYPEEEPSLYKPAPYTPSKKPLTIDTRFNQPPSYQPSYYSQQVSKPTAIMRQTQSPSRNQPLIRRQMTGFTKICPRCRRTIRDDYNICPYCNKKLR
jgi:hypothetical protein